MKAMVYGMKKAPVLGAFSVWCLLGAYIPHGAYARR